MSKWMAIVNQRAGGVNRSMDGILRRVRQLAGATAVTEYPGHATELARQAEAFAGVIVVGGDGTVLQVLNGLDRARQRLAIVAAGRGNSLARDLGLYPPALGLGAVEAGRTMRIDLMEVLFQDAAGGQQRSVSASTIAVGYPAAVARAALRYAWLSHHSYIAGSALLRPRKQVMHVEGFNAPPARNTLTGFIANNTRHVANFVAFPRASCRDGVFDVMELRAGYPAQVAHNLSALTGLHFYQPAAPRQTMAASVRLECPQDLMIDGELHPGVTAFEVRVLPVALTIQAGNPT